jgi:zinc transporter ZupT
VGDYGILLSAGFNSWQVRSSHSAAPPTPNLQLAFLLDLEDVGGVMQALGFNFLSALVALAGTAFALAVGTGSGAGSGLVEGFTAGGFIYISVAGVIPMMHTQRNDSVLLQLLSMVGGVVVCVAIHANGGCDGHP